MCIILQKKGIQFILWEVFPVTNMALIFHFSLMFFTYFTLHTYFFYILCLVSQIHTVSQIQYIFHSKYIILQYSSVLFIYFLFNIIHQDVSNSQQKKQRSYRWTVPSW